MTGPAAPASPPPRRYLANLRDIRAGKVDPLSEALNAASDQDPELRQLMDAKASGIVFSPTVGKFVVMAVHGKSRTVSVAVATSREDAERLLANAPRGGE